MKTVTVNASKAYDIKIGPGLLSSLGAEAAALGKAKKVAIVSETKVYPLYGKLAEESLEAAGLEVVSFVFPAGEESKCAATYLELLNFLADNKLTRTDLIVALGGGVVGDLAGFAAATYLRGIRFIQIPTTLLAAVDSSVGGKTAIDLSAGKNLVGAFWQPSLVLCDTDTLTSLPLGIFLDGCAEVIKYGILYDEAFFSYLESTGPEFDREAVIARCVEMKRDVVMEDEFDTGARMKLNLGHTIGHGVEASSNFTLSHGKSVAIGMAIVSRASHCSDNDRIIGILKQFGLPTTTSTGAETLLNYAFANFTLCPLPEEEALPAVPVVYGSAESVPLRFESERRFVLAAKGGEDCRFSYTLSEALPAPVREGDMAGTLIVTRGGEEITRLALVAAADVGRIGVWGIFLKLAGSLFGL